MFVIRKKQVRVCEKHRLLAHEGSDVLSSANALGINTILAGGIRLNYLNFLSSSKHMWAKDHFALRLPTD